MLVPVSISRLLIREMADSQFVTLQELEGGRSFPIAIGLTEAFAIERRMGGATPPRPQTHDLLDSAIASLGGTLVRVEIHTLDGGTFHARLVLERDGETIEVDSRPSDAIALGVARDTPILVDEKVIDEAVVSYGTGDLGESESPFQDEVDEDDDSEFR